MLSKLQDLRSACRKMFGFNKENVHLSLHQDHMEDN